MNSAEKRITLLLYLFILMTTILATSRKNYIIQHSKDSDPLAALDPNAILDSSQEIIFAGELFNITFAQLLEEDLKFVNGIVHEDAIFTLDDNDLNTNTTEHSPDKTINALRTGSVTSKFSSSLYDFTITSTIPKCNASVSNNISVVIIDSVFAPSVYLKHNVTLLYSFVGTTVCPYFRHGAQVASVFSEMIPHGNMEIQSIGAFGCDKKASAYSVIKSVELVIQQAKTHPKIKYIINFSGAGPSLSAVNEAFIEAEKQGIATYVAAGNKKENCMSYSPAQAAAYSSVSTIGSNCDDIPCTFTNYETPSNDTTKKCVTLNLPGCVDVTNTINGNRENICGTSFSSPIAAARHAIAQEYNPDLDSSEIKSLVLSKGVHAVAIPTGAHFGNGVWDVLDQAYACPMKSASRTIFNAPILYHNSRLTVWYNATTSAGSLCIKFSAQSLKKANLIIGARTTKYDMPTVSFRLDKKNSRAKKNVRFKHCIYKITSNGKIKKIAAATTKKRVLTSDYKEFRLEQRNSTLLLQYKHYNEMELLVKGDFNPELKQIAFAGRNIRVQNARLCYTT